MILATCMVPRVVIGVPTYLTMMKVGVLDTYFALIPRELEEAAIIDEANRMQAFLRTVRVRSART